MRGTGVDTAGVGSGGTMMRPWLLLDVVLMLLVVLTGVVVIVELRVVFSVVLREVLLLV